MSVCVLIQSQKELPFLRETGLRLAGALQQPLEFWVAASDDDNPDWVVELDGVGVSRIANFSGKDRRSRLFVEARNEWPELLVVGKWAKSSQDDPDRKLASDLFDSVGCQVLVMRLSKELSQANSRILVPCAGGRHSRRALKLAHALSPSGAVAFQMRPDADELSSEVGHQHLEKMISKAGLPAGEIATKVVVGNDFPAALATEAKEGDYSMILIGASGAGTLRRKLFGSIPDRSLEGSDGISIGVIRAEQSKGHRVRNAVGRLIHVHIPQLSRSERLALFEEVESKSRWNFDFAALMVLATAIAAMGLLVNSGAVVIGAMLVAPLMMPLIGTGLSLVQGNWPLCRQALSAVIRGFFFALVFAYGMGLAARFLELGLTEQLLMRGEPNALDLGIGFVSGIAASYCIARPKLSGALAGVAIAAALVPPIATVGICFAMGQEEIAMGAALLFGTNIVAIVLGAGLNFLLAGIRGKQKTGEWGRRGMIALVLLCFGLAVPLTSVLLSRLSRSPELESVVQEVIPDSAKLVSLNRRTGGGYEITLESPSPLPDGVIVDLKKVIEEREGRDVKIRMRTHLIREK